MQVGTTNSRELAANKAVFTMQYEQRAMDMDSLEAPPGQLLTGVKLRNIGGHLNLEIQVTITILTLTLLELIRFR